MKQIVFLLALSGAVCGNVFAAPVPANAAAANRVLLIDPSTMPVAAGKATLIIGALQRTNGVYSGDYRLKVFPYFLKNDKGRLVIYVSDATLADVNQGKVAAITGTATTSAQSGRSRAIEAIAIPADINHGTLKLWFTAGGREMIFTPAYHFAGKEMAAVQPPSPTTSLGGGGTNRLSDVPPEIVSAANNL
jgi:hypothetical protein